MARDDEKNSLTGRVVRHARVGANVGTAAMRIAGGRMFGDGDLGREGRLIADALGGLKGPLMKVAQLLATIPDAIPAEWASELQRLQAHAPAMGWAFVRRRMMAELGADWASLNMLLIGTGSYAGAVVAAARARGVRNITVHSASGRGAEFAASHGTAQVSSVTEGLATADLVVTCRGQGATVVGVDDVTRSATFLDLSLRRDVDPRVGWLTGVRLIDLPTIQDSLGSGIAEDTRRAQAIVNEGIAVALTKLRSRVVDPAVVGLRESVMAMVDDEVARLPQRPLTHDAAALALRRLATRLLHVPSSRARLAAEQGRTDEYLHAMEELYGIGAPVDINPNAMEELTCPVTNLKVCDLETVHKVSEAV